MSWNSAVPVEDETYPGESLGLPAEGPNSLASWRSRIGALLIDWGASTLAAMAMFGTAIWHDRGPVSFAVLIIFFLESTLLGIFAQGSFGQLITRIRVLRLDGEPLGVLRSASRAFLVCLALPAMVVGMHRRGLHDLAVNTVVVNRK